MLKKTAVAAAVAGVCGAPMAFAGDGVETYGFVNVTLDYAKEKNGGTPALIFLPPSSDGDFHLGDQANSRFGFRGSNDLGNGLTAGYRIEIGFGTSGFQRGSVREDAAPWDKRLAWVNLSGGWGELKLGNMWGALYEYQGWNTFRQHGFGGATWYEGTKNLRNDAYGLRVSDAIKYTWGSGGYGTDPFTFTVQPILDQVGDQNGAPGAQEDIDAITVAGQAHFANTSINAAYYTDNSTGPGTPEPEYIGVGFQSQITDALYFGGRYSNTDRDVGGNDEIDVFALHVDYQFGNGLLGMIGGGWSDNEMDGDLTTLNLFLQKDMGQGLLFYGEFEWAQRDSVVAGQGDPESSVIAVGFKQNF